MLLFTSIAYSLNLNLIAVDSLYLSRLFIRSVLVISSSRYCYQGPKAILGRPRSNVTASVLIVLFGFSSWFYVSRPPGLIFTVTETICALYNGDDAIKIIIIPTVTFILLQIHLLWKKINSQYYV